MSVWELDALSVSADDGRALEVVVGGPSDGIPLFLLTERPGAAGPFDRLIETGAERRAPHRVLPARIRRLRSTCRGGRWLPASADVVAIADALGYDRFYCSGGSGGGPHSIACAALFPDRVIAVAAIATPAPVDAQDFDWTADMGKDNVEEFGAARSGDRALREYLEREARSMLGASAQRGRRPRGDLFCEADRRALSGAFAEFMVRELGAFAVDRHLGLVRRRSRARRRLGVRPRPRSPFHSHSGTAPRTISFRSRTANGWPRHVRR